MDVSWFLIEGRKPDTEERVAQILGEAATAIYKDST